MDWNDYFLNVAKSVALKSKDPSTKVGCVIVDIKNRPVSFGYNGFIAGCDESKMTNERPMKYNLVVHAEMNAILFSDKSLDGCVLYCTHASCENCLKHALQAGIRTFVFDSYNPTDRASKESKTAITKMILATGADCVVKVNGKFISYHSLIMEDINGKV